MSEIVVLSKDEFIEIIDRTVKLAVEKAQENFDKPFPEIMKLSQIAKYLGVSENTVRARLKSNNLPHSRQLGDLRFHKPEVDKWMFGNKK